MRTYFSKCKIPATLLAVWMALSMLPIPARAAVTASETAACVIGTTEYATLTAALAAAQDGDTVRLLESITHTSPVVIGDMEITFDLNGYDLAIDTSATENSTALTAGAGGNVGYNTPGTFTVCGGKNGYGVLAKYGGQASVGGVLIKTDYTEGVYAVASDSRITVNGDIRTTGGDYTRTVGAAAGMEAKVTVYGTVSISGSNIVGVLGATGGEVEVSPPGGGTAISVNGDFALGADVRNQSESKVTVNGSVEAVGDSSTGVCADFGQVTINGSVMTDGNYSVGAMAKDYGNVRVNGNVAVAGLDVKGVRADMGEGAGGIVWVTGDVVVADADDESFGIYCYSSGAREDKSAVKVDGQVTVSGAATAPHYLQLDGDVRTKDSKDSVDDGGYWVYNGPYGSVVKAGNGTATSSLATVTTEPVDPLEITSTGGRVRGGVTATGGAEITAFGFAWGFNANPTTANHTAAGTGTAPSFTADLFGLVPNQTYYVRAYATNSAGTAYGESRSFTTAASDPLAAPLNLRYLAYDSAVELIWDAPPSASPITHYEVMRGNDLAGGTWINVGDVTSYMVTGLTNGENTTFNLRAVNAEGPGAHGFLRAMANIPAPPGPPHSLSAFGNDGKVRLSWNTPYYNGHREITDYLVSADSISWTDVGRDRSYEFTGLVNGTTYTLYVRAVNAVGAGEIASVQGTPRSIGGGYVGGGSSGYHNSISILPAKKPDQPVMAKTDAQAGIDSDGNASLTITDAMVKALLETAQANAKSTGKAANDIGAAVNILFGQTTGSITITIEAAAIDRLENAGARLFTLNNPLVDFTLDAEAIGEINRQATGAVTVSIKPVKKLSATAERIIGSRPAYDITVSYQNSGGIAYISDLKKGRVTLGIAYAPGANRKTDNSYGIGDTPYQERPGHLYAVYVDKNGNPQRLQASAYAGGRIIFERGSLSVYGVGYTTPTEKYTDLVTHWARESIDYAVGRGLFGGTADTTFSPDTAMSRGMLVTVLGRLAGVDTTLYTTNRFTDVKADSAFRPYIEWAYEKGIEQGVGNRQFAPDRAITREEIAVVFANYAKATGYKLPVTREATAYADASSIGGVYKTAVTAMQQAGIMMGGAGNKFNPEAGATRAEVSAMLHRYVKLTTDPATAWGWALNDDGQWLYYKDGKPLTGTHTIDSTKYHFETNGALKTDWMQDGGNWRFYSGNKLLIGWRNIGSDTAQRTYYFDAYGNMAAGKWLQLDGKWHYFNADGSLARNITVDGYEVDENGVRKTE